LLGIWSAASRAVFGALPFVIVLAIYSRAMPVRRLVVAAILAACVVIFVAMLPPIVSIIFSLPQRFKIITAWIIYGIPSDFSGLNIASPSLRYDVPGQFVSGPNTESSNVERIASLQGALKIFLDHPIFGGGLGLFVAEHLRQFGKTLVIHSTPLWLLAETGIVGLFVVATLFARVLNSEFRLVVRGDSIALMIVLMLLALGIVSLVHDLFYQRGFWFLFGAAMAMLPVAGTKHGATETQK
jgi:O-antigen ligase